MSGIWVFNSNCPMLHASAITCSLPITCRQAMFAASQMLGFTLPGMMDEPGSTAGSTISANPVFGPDASSRRSLQILCTSIAASFSAPAISAMSVRNWVISIPFSAPSYVVEVSSPSSRTMTGRKSFFVLSPVPIALPPIPSLNNFWRAASMRRISFSSAHAYAANSWPRRIGTASARCVRPLLNTSLNSNALFLNSAIRLRSPQTSFADRSTPAILIADGMTLFVDCPMLT
ncbi:MAG: hypothetical protein BWY59_01443 [Verrucomicrobia bacterium ADurb.Bin345]|nr:MAG: hypothetical protein BWY59_01443 [Verrucomicrobia bacterium ADurb.Bin345]